MDELIEQLLGNVINGQQANSKEFKELFSKVQEELNAIKNKGSDTQAVEELKRLIVRQTSEIEELKNKKQVLDLTKFSNSEPTRNITIFGGNNAQITYRWALFASCFILFSYFGWKYLPSYLIESKALEAETARNSTYVTFLRLKQFKEHGGTKEIDMFLNKIEHFDSTFVKEYNSLLAHYSQEIERLNTEKEIKELQDKLKNNEK